MRGYSWTRLGMAWAAFAGVIAVASGCTVLVGLELVPPATDEEGGPPPAGSSAGENVIDATSPSMGAVEAGVAADSTITDAPVADAGAPDAEADADADAAPLRNPGLGASLLFAGSSLKIKGITLDGWILYLDTSGSNFDYRVIPVPAADAGVQLISAQSYQEIAHVPYGSSADALVINNLAFTWGGGVLTLWSSALGRPITISDYSVQDAVWASNDSSHFAYIDSMSGALYGVDGDGTNRQMVLSSVDSRCGPSVTFAGNYLVVAYCPGGTSTHLLESFDISKGWAPSLQTPESMVSSLVDPEGTMVVAPVPVGGTPFFEVFSLDGGPGNVLDPSTPFIYGENNAGALTYPWYIVYNDDAGALKQAYASLSPPPRVLVDAGINSFVAVSPSGHWLVVANKIDGTYEPLDLSVASMSDPGTPQFLAASTDGKSLRSSPQSGTGFTADERYALFYTSVTLDVLDPSQLQKVTVGTFNAKQLSPPYGGFTALATNVFDDHSVGGSRVLLLDNAQLLIAADGGGSVVVDLDEIDLSKADAGLTSIVKAVPREVAVTSTGAQVAYVVPQTTAAEEAGIYVAPIP